LDNLKAKAWHVELATVLDKLRDYRQAAKTLVDYDPILGEAYALKKGDAQVLGLVFESILHSSGYVSALAMAERSALQINVLQVLAALGNDVPFTSLANLVRMGLQSSESKHRDHLVVRQLVKHENLMAMQDLALLKSQYVLMDKNKRCVVCGRGFKPDTAFVRLPENEQGQFLLAHAACHSR